MKVLPKPALHSNVLMRESWQYQYHKQHSSSSTFSINLNHRNSLEFIFKQNHLKHKKHNMYRYQHSQVIQSQALIPASQPLLLQLLVMDWNKHF